MTDHEIIKAIKYCASIDRENCDKCDYRNEDDCIILVTQDALDLIERQEERIAEADSFIKNLHFVISEYAKEDKSYQTNQKIEDAIDYIERERLRLIDYFGDEKHPEKIEAVETALDVLRKERERKPISDGPAERLCPTCDRYIPFDGLNGKVENAPKRCAECGQKLFWS